MGQSSAELNGQHGREPRKARQKKPKADARANTKPAKESRRQGSRSTVLDRLADIPTGGALSDLIEVAGGDEIGKAATTWLWPGRIAYGELTILEARKGTGKSSMCRAIAAAVTCGGTLPGGESIRPGCVLWFPGEESIAEQVLPGLDLAGAKLGMVKFPGYDRDGVCKHRLTLPGSTSTIMQLVERLQVRLLVIDPIFSFTDRQLSTTFDSDARQILEPLLQGVRATGCACLLTRNLNKTRGGPALDQGMGSSTFGNVARCVLRASMHPTLPGIRVVWRVAGNLGKSPSQISYTLEGPGDMARVAWGGESSISTDELQGDLSDAGHRDHLQDAKRFLRDELARGAKQVTDLQKHAENAGLSWATVRRAKTDLGVSSEKIGATDPAFWQWCPPKNGWPADL